MGATVSDKLVDIVTAENTVSVIREQDEGSPCSTAENSKDGVSDKHVDSRCAP